MHAIARDLALSMETKIGFPHDSFIGSPAAQIGESLSRFKRPQGDDPAGAHEHASLRDDGVLVVQRDDGGAFDENSAGLDPKAPMAGALIHPPPGECQLRRERGARRKQPT
jgi:hypothetical protein